MTGRYNELDYEIVGVGEVGHARGSGHVLATHPLGSCLGVTVFDSHLHLGFVMHVPLPDSAIDEALARERPYMFVDTALPAVFHEFFELGGRRQRMEVKVAGGAVPATSGRKFWIGERNVRNAVRVCRNNEIQVTSNAVGGIQSRCMRLVLSTGMVVLSNGAQEWIL